MTLLAKRALARLHDEEYALVTDQYGEAMKAQARRREATETYWEQLEKNSDYALEGVA